MEKIKFTEVTKMTRKLSYCLFWSRKEEAEEIRKKLCHKIYNIIDEEKMKNANGKAIKRLLSKENIAPCIIRAISSVDIIPAKYVDCIIHCYPHATSVPNKYEYDYEGGYIIVKIKNNYISIAKYLRGNCATKTSHGNGKRFPMFTYYMGDKMRIKLSDKLEEQWLAGNNLRQLR